MGVVRGVVHMFFMTRHTRIICFGALELEASAGRMAMEAVELAGLDARAHSPRCVRVVLAKIATVWIEVHMFQRREIVVIEEAVAGQKRGFDRYRLGVARRTRLTREVSVYRLLPAGRADSRRVPPMTR